MAETNELCQLKATATTTVKFTFAMTGAACATPGPDVYLVHQNSRVDKSSRHGAAPSYSYRIHPYEIVHERADSNGSEKLTFFPADTSLSCDVVLSLLPRASLGFRSPLTQKEVTKALMKNWVAQWVSNNDGVVRSLPVYTGGVVLFNSSNG